MLFFQGRGAAELSSCRKTNPETDADPNHNPVETAGAAVSAFGRFTVKS
jgi:hypothetical protein